MGFRPIQLDTRKWLVSLGTRSQNGAREDEICIVRIAVEPEPL